MIKRFFISVLVLITLSICLFVGLSVFKSKEKVFKYQDIDRRYRLHIPSNLDSGKSYPLVIALHGLTDDPRIMELYTGFSSQADKKGFYVVYPYGLKAEGLFSPRSWNGEFCCNFSYEKNIDDAGFINALIDEISSNYNIDKNRIYLTGYSNGGMLAYSLASKLSDKILSFAVVNSAIGGKVKEEEGMKFISKSYKPVSIAIINSRFDKSIPFDGGPGSGVLYEFSAAYDNVNFWLDNDGCNKYPNEIAKKGDYQEEIYNECKDGKKVVFYSVSGSHVWPGGLFDPVKFFLKDNFRATNEVLNFFGL